ncbi:MAG: family 20 glycosylhydrolase [Chitinophagales bacterium]
MRQFLILCLCLFGLIIQARQIDTLYLIPQPKVVLPVGNFYNLKQAYKTNYNSSDSFSAKQILSLLPEAAANSNSINKSDIRLVTLDSLSFLQLARAQGWDIPFTLGNEGYVLQVKPKSILIAARSHAGVFYATQTLAQLIQANTKDSLLPCLTIFDKPDMAMRGWQDDISRGPIPTLNFLKEEVRRMASYKLNTFTLYTEHVYKLKKHPTIAPTDGISEEEIKQLTAFAKNYHVDVIGNFQSFGHFSNILKTPGYENLAENPQTLSPAKEASYKFLKDVYSEVAPAYESNYFQINCDEVSLGSGPCKSMIDSIGISGVYAYHINRIDSLLKPYNKRIMMWGDIAVHNPDIIARLPKDMIIVSWDYGPLESMDDKIEPFTKSGFQFIVAPGVSCWSRIYPDMQRASINIYNYLRDGHKRGALGFINTTWDDSGQNLFNNNWYSLIWGAECGWSAPANEPVKQSDTTRRTRLAEFNNAYNHVYYHTQQNTIGLLLAISDLRNGPVKNCLSDAAMWSPLLPDYEVILQNYENRNLTIIHTIDSLIQETNRLKPYFGNHAEEYELAGLALRQARFVANKNLLSIKLRNYISSGTNLNIKTFKKDFAALDDTISSLKTTYTKLWQLENRNWWLDTVLNYYNSFKGNLQNLKGVCIINSSDTLINNKREIKLRSAFNKLPVYYSVDGSTPSARYTAPLYVDSNVLLKAVVVSGKTKYGVEQDSLLFHKGIGTLYKLNTKWYAENPTYAARGKYALLDGRRGNPNNFSDGRWQGYFGTDIDIELDLGKTQTLNQLSMNFGQLMRYGILYPAQVQVSTSPDGINYKVINTISNTISANTEERSTHNFIIHLNGINTRYLQVVAKNAGLLPEWHYAKGNKSWLFADEIVVE